MLSIGPRKKPGRPARAGGIAVAARSQTITPAYRIQRQDWAEQFDGLDENRGRRFEAESAAQRKTSALVQQLMARADLPLEEKQSVLAAAVLWLPHRAPALHRLWRSRSRVEDLVAMPLADLTLARRRSQEIDAASLFRQVNSELPAAAEATDPQLAGRALFRLLWSMREQRLDWNALSPETEAQARNILKTLRKLLISGDYRRGGAGSCAAELLLCQLSEMWRRTLPLTSGLKPALEQAVRWELQVEAADSPMARSALLIAAENLHLKGVDPRRLRVPLVDSGTSGSKRAPRLRRADGKPFQAASLLTSVFVIRALAGQPRTLTCH